MRCDLGHARRGGVVCRTEEIFPFYVLVYGVSRKAIAAVDFFYGVRKKIDGRKKSTTSLRTKQPRGQPVRGNKTVLFPRTVCPRGCWFAISF